MLEINNLEELTDKGNAKRFVRLADGVVRYVLESDDWYSWTNGLWGKDIGGGTMSVIDKVRGELLGEIGVFHREKMKLIERHGDEHDDVKAVKKVIADSVANHTGLGNKRRHADLLYFAAMNNDLVVSIKDFDSKGLYFGTLNGVYDVRRKTLVSNDPKYMVTKRVATDYIPGAECPLWEGQLDMVCKGDKEMIAYLQRIAGQALLGVSKSTMLIFTGSGANGKSTYVKTLVKLLGDYANTTDANVIIGDGSNKEYYMSALRGLRLTSMSETQADAKMANALVKNLVDSEGINARDPRGKPFSFFPVMTPILSTNHVPIIGDDDAVWRRIQIVRWDYRIPDTVKDENFVDNVLVPEFSGILNWCITGAEAYLEQGLNPPKSVITSTNKERDDQDRIKTFIEMYCVADANGKIKTADLREMYDLDCVSGGVRALGRIQFNNALERKGYEVIKDTTIPGAPKVLVGYRFPKGFDILTSVRRDKELLILLADKKVMESEDKIDSKLTVLSFLK